MRLARFIHCAFCVLAGQAAVKCTIRSRDENTTDPALPQSLQYVGNKCVTPVSSGTSAHHHLNGGMWVGVEISCTKQAQDDHLFIGNGTYTPTSCL